eukprot:6183108-Pleurochrysis_carterae.AAC.2
MGRRQSTAMASKISPSHANEDVPLIKACTLLPAFPAANYLRLREQLLISMQAEATVQAQPNWS